MATKPDKKEAILEAMLDLIVERGFHDAPMSLLAKRSGASAGVIYHYFPSKEEIIHSLYLRVKDLKRQALLAGYDPSMSPHDVFVQVWTNAYHFYRDHLRETRFLSQYLSSPYGCNPEPEEAPAEDKIASEFQSRFRSYKRGGLLNDLPPEAHHELSFGLAMHLAINPKPLTRSQLAEVAETSWQAITAR